MIKCANVTAKLNKDGILDKFLQQIEQQKAKKNTLML